MKKSFTLIELIVVIIIIGILATLAFMQYTKVIEKGRTAEAKSILGTIRTAQEAYRLENGSYATSIADLPVEAPTGCVTTHYFWYKTGTLTAPTGAPTGTTGNPGGTATRCISGGKTPNSGTAYIIEIDYANGTWSGTPGYY